MKHIVRKPYWDYQKEEKWINEMSEKGLNLKDYSWCKYTFEDSEDGAYIYRLELLENSAKNVESIAYIRFLEESGVEHVASYQRWVYLRKKASEGPFEVYTDIESKIKYYQRVNSFWMTIGIAELLIGMGNLGLVTSIYASGEAINIAGLNFVGGLLCTIMGIAFLVMSNPLRKKIRQLKKDAEVHQ